MLSFDQLAAPRVISADMTDVKTTEHDALSHHSFDKSAPALEAGVDELNQLDEDALNAMERKLVRRIDLRMMPALILIYIMYARGHHAAADRTGTTWIATTLVLRACGASRPTSARTMFSLRPS